MNRSLRSILIRRLFPWLAGILFGSLLLGTFITLNYYVNDRELALQHDVKKLEPHLARAAWQVNPEAVEFALNSILIRDHIIRVNFTEKFTAMELVDEAYRDTPCAKTERFQITGSTNSNFKLDNAFLEICQRQIKAANIALYLLGSSLPYLLTGLLISLVLYWITNSVVLQPFRQVSHALNKGDDLLEFDLQGEGGKSDEFRTLIRNIRSRSLALNQEKDRATAWFEGSSDGLVIMDQNGRVIQYNKRSGAMIPEVTQPGLAFQRVIDQAATEELLGSPERILRRSDDMVLLIRTTAIGQQGDNKFLITIQDITDRMQAMLDNAQSEKLAIMGHLASGISHDFNNILSVIRASTQVIETSKTLDNSDAEILHDMNNAIDAGHTLTKQMRQFSRKSDLQASVVKASTVVQTAASLFSRSLKGAMECKIDIQDDGLISTEKMLLVNVLVNLLTNARDASVQGSVISIICRRTKNKLGRNLIEFVVDDHGRGIPKHEISRVLEPFYTTKSEYEGTGLGLTSAKRFTQKWGGRFDIRSTVGKGTTVSLGFEELSHTNLPQSVKRQPIPLMESKPRLLIVEDYLALLKIVQIQISGLGFDVYTASAIEDALAHLASGRSFDIVLCDVHLGHSHGSEVFRNFRERGSDASFIFMSGDFRDSDVASLDSIGPHAKLDKPFKAADFFNVAVAVLEWKETPRRRLN